MSDSDSNAIFITQSTFVEKLSTDPDTDAVLSDILDMQENMQPNFNLRNSIFSDISSADDESIFQCSMEIEKMDSRFRIPLNTVDLQNMVDSGKSAKTENKTRWAINLFANWQKERERVTKSKQYSSPILEMKDSLLNEALSLLVK